MKVYKIIATSWVLWIITLMGVIFGGLLLFGVVRSYLPKNEAIPLLLTIFLMSLAFFIQRFISTAIVEIELTDDSITIKWISQFIFHSRPDRVISFSEIETYKYQEDRNFDLFKLTLKDGTDIRLWHGMFTRKDDFDKLIMDFSDSVTHFNKHISNKKDLQGTPHNKTKIEKTKNIFESDAAPFLAIIAVIFMIVIPILLFSNHAKGLYNYLLSTSSFFGAVFFLRRYIQYRKKNTNN